MQGDRPLKVVLVPASQRQAVGLDLAHRRTVADGERGDGGTHSRILRLGRSPAIVLGPSRALLGHGGAGRCAGGCGRSHSHTWVGCIVSSTTATVSSVGHAPV
jgi:hypothetical protein